MRLFTEFFVWFHIVYDRYTLEYAHFTYFNTIWPLSLSSNFGTAFITLAHSLSYMVEYTWEFPPEYHCDILNKINTELHKLSPASVFPLFLSGEFKGGGISQIAVCGPPSFRLGPDMPPTSSPSTLPKPNLPNQTNPNQRMGPKYPRLVFITTSCEDIQDSSPN